MEDKFSKIERVNKERKLKIPDFALSYLNVDKKDKIELDLKNEKIIIEKTKKV